MATRSGVRPVAIALVVQEEDGSLTIWGSKSLRTAELEMRNDASLHYGDSLMYTPGRMSYRIEAECRDLVMQRTTPAPCPPQIEQRGIYLPDMSFRALPSPEDA